MSSSTEQQRAQKISDQCLLQLSQIAVDAKRGDMTVLRARELKRIRDASLTSNMQLEREKNEKQQKDRNDLHRLSKERVKKWANTIEGQRLKRLQSRKIKSEQDEIAKKKLDVEEAELQARKRKEAIKDAKRLQYMQTDRVKGFHAALTLTEVLKERDAQVDMKAKKQEFEKTKFDKFLAEQNENYRESLLEEAHNVAEKNKTAYEIAQFQKLQIEDRIRIKNEERKENKAEGEQIKEQYENYKKVTDMIKKHNNKCKEELRDTYTLEMELKKQRAKDEEKVKEEFDKEIKKFVNAKRQMARLRQQKEEELFNDFQAHTKKICDKLLADTQARTDDEDDRIARAVYEQEMKRVKEEEEKAQAELEAIKETNLQRIRMIEDHAEERKMDMLRDKAFLDYRMKEDRKFKESVEKARKKRRANAVEIQDFYKRQTKSREEKTRKEIEKQLELDVENSQQMIDEEDIFQQYAEQVIQDAKHNKRALFPLLKAKNEGPGGGRGPRCQGNAGLRPSYIVKDDTGVQLPHYLKDDDTYKKTYGHVGRTSNRLGFNW